MNLMLAVIFASVALGLFARRFGVREQLLLLGMATMMATLYLFVGRMM
jgi:hypothetical protein